jgi:uncharacterized membrane protein
MRKAPISYLIPIVTGLIFGLFLGFSGSIHIWLGAILFSMLFAILWLGYSFLISKISKKGFLPILRKDAFSFLPFLILLLFPMTKAIEFKSKYGAFGNLPSYFLLTLSISLFISIKVLLYDRKIRDVKTRKLVFIPILAYFILLSILAILKHFSFFSTAFDLGFYTQNMWAWTHGITSSSLMEVHFLGNHIQPILLLIAPIYFLFSSPITLLIIQTFFIAIAAWPLYLLAKEKTGNNLFSLIISIAYLCYLPIWYTNLFDFHPVALAIPFIMFAIYFLEKKRYKAFVVSMILASSCKEYVSLLFVPFGVYLFIKHKKRILGITTAVLGVLWFVLIISAIIPYFLGSDYFFFQGNSMFGDNLYEVIKTLIFNPMFVAGELLSFGRLGYLVVLLAPVGFGIFAIFGIEFLFLGITEFLIVLLHHKDALPEIVYHHQITLVAFVMAASVTGACRVVGLIRKRGLRYLNKNNLLLGISIFILFTSISTNIIYGPFSVLYDLRDFDTRSEYVETGNKIIGMIPKDASVAAPNWIVPHLSQRENVFMLANFLKNSTYIEEQPEYLVLDFSDAINDPKRSARKIDLNSYKVILGNADYEVEHKENAWVLLKRK